MYVSPPCCIDFGTSVQPIEKAQDTQICSISISDFNLCARILNTYTRVCIIKHIDTCSSKFTTWCEIIKQWKKKHSLLIRFDKCNIRPKKITLYTVQIIFHLYALSSFCYTSTCFIALCMNEDSVFVFVFLFFPFLHFYIFSQCCSIQSENNLN